MPKFKHYTAELIETQIKEIIKRYPDNINPMSSDGVACLYHKGRGRNIQRCLIGQWGFEQGFRSPDPDQGDAEDVVEEVWSKQAEFDSDAISIMLKFQRIADGSRSVPVAVPIPWKEILPLS